MKKEELLNLLKDKETWSVYKHFQEVEKSIDESSELLLFYDDIKELFSSSKEHTRLRVFILLVKLSKYDKRIVNDIDFLLEIFSSSKPTIVRQALSYSKELIANIYELKGVIVKRAEGIDLDKFKDSMRPLIVKDIECLKTA